MTRVWLTLMPLFAAAILFWGAAHRQVGLAATRQAGNPAQPEAFAQAPPALTFATVLLGGFRGLLADALWLRATRLQETGRFVELVTLTDWIARLEPRATGIWGYHAWNLAYNVSAMMATPDERWQWIHHGIRLLRDEGLRFNPGDPRLHFELGWLFQHKLGQAADPLLPAYRARWAAEVATVLPGGRLPDPAAPGFDVTRRALRDTLGLDPAAMHALEATHGPLDWRLPEVHSLYWAVTGIGRAPGSGADFLCRRMACQSLALLFFGGGHRADEAHADTPPPNPPRFDLLAPLQARFAAERRDGVWPQATEAHLRFMESAIPVLRRAGRNADADRLAAEYHTLAPAAP